MRVLDSLFAKSPFAPLQSHMEKVAACVQKVEEMFQAYVNQNFDEMDRIADEISALEHAADLTKNDIRNNLPKGLFLAVNRGDLLEILGLQDDIADMAEDIGGMMTLKRLEPLEGIEADLKIFLDKNIEAATQAHNIIRQMDELLSASFGGKEAEKVKEMIEHVAYLEHEADILQRNLSKKLYNMDDKLSYSSFALWVNVLQSVASLGNLAEKLANRVRMLLELK